MNLPRKTRSLLTGGLLSLTLAPTAHSDGIETVGGFSTASLLADSDAELRMTYTDFSSALTFQCCLDGTFAPLRLWQITGVTDFTINPPGFSGPVEIRSEELHVESYGPIQRYIADSNDSGSSAFHIWHEDTASPSDRLMQLEHNDKGDLLIGGQLSVNQFDLAERFFERTPVEPGELVSVDPENPAFVQPTGSAYEATMLGVASATPGLVLGRRGFSVEDVQRTWGEGVAGEFEFHRPDLEALALAELPELHAMAEAVSSFANFEGHSRTMEQEVLAALPQRSAERSAERGAELSQGAPEISPELLAAAYETARGTYEMLLFDAAAQRFFDDRFTSVALAGRVRVKVDASFGPIRAGDYLTSSPIPGVAMRASRQGPIVGTALEGLTSGSGSVEVFVHRGWYGGPGQSVLTSSAPDAKDLRIIALETRLDQLERRLEGLAPPARRAGLAAN